MLQSAWRSMAQALPALVLLAASFTPIRGGQEPFEAESANLLRQGLVEVEFGVEAAEGARRVIFPLEEGRDIRFPTLGLRTGLGAWAELRIEGDLVRRFDPERGAGVDGAGDWRVATKLRVGPDQGRWRWAAWFGAKLPVASDNEGLGTNLTDLDVRALATVQTGASTVDLNGGIAILGAPFRERAQVDLMTYAIAYRFRLGDELEMGFEWAGREGGDFFGALSSLRTGLRWQRTRWSWHGSIAVGLTEASPSSELRAGAALRFDRKNR